MIHWLKSQTELTQKIIVAYDTDEATIFANAKYQNT